MPESERKAHPEHPDDDDVEEVDESSDESFPASDPPSWAMGKRAEPKPAPGPARPMDEAQRRDLDRRQPGGSESGSKPPRR
jgi:hypothetical protein